MKVLIVADGLISGNSDKTDPGWYMHLTLDDLGISHELFYHSGFGSARGLSNALNLAWKYVRRKSYSRLIDGAAGADRRLLSLVRQGQPALIIVYKGRLLRRAVIEEMRRVCPTAKIVYMTYDNIFYNPNALLSADAYDVCYLADSYMIEKMKRLGCRQAAFMPEACYPKAYMPLTDITPEERQRYSCDVSMVGSLYPYRLKMLEALEGVDFRMWGNLSEFLSAEDFERSFVYARHQRRAVHGRAKTLIFNLSKVNLTTLQPRECICSGNTRIHQVAACGAFQLVEYNADLERCYTLGSELMTFKGRDELRELVEYYLRNESERNAIARRAQDRALRDHTFECRIKQMAQDVGISL
ncbi:MAG TPA: glycosyltransferase, partial [Candidatus Bathyarchaeia archaeon]|nr:glycosyltransferase [Candidatus Bathyarchaeia archaeon]